MSAATAFVSFRHPVLPWTVSEGDERRFRRIVRNVLIVCLLLPGCALPRWPADGTLTSVYGLRFLGWRPDIHHGIDIAAPEGTEVRAMSSGRVSYAGTMGGYGNVIFLDHGTTGIRHGLLLRSDSPHERASSQSVTVSPHIHGTSSR